MAPRKRRCTPRRRVALLLVPLGLCVGVGAARSAPAASPPARPDARSGATAWDPATRQAKAEFDQAEKHYYRAEFRDALRHYQAALKHKRLPALYFNIAQCHRQLGEAAKARFFYKLYLERRPRAANRAEVQRRIQQMERRIAAARVRSAKAQKPPPPVPYYRRWWFWTGLATAAVLSGAAVGTGVQALRMQDQWERTGGQPDVSYDFEARSKALRISTDVLLGAAGATALATIIAAVVVAHRRPARERAAQILPSCGPTGCSLVVQGRF